MTRSTNALIVATLVSLASTPLMGQEPEKSAAAPEHQLLKKFVGEWTSESEATLGPGQEPMKCSGTIRSRMLGNLWSISDVTVHAGGGSVTAVQTIGYDPKSQKYVGTWVDSMMNHLWEYEGSFDESGQVLSLYAEGPNMMLEGKMSKYRDSYEFKSDDHILVTSSMLDDEGNWVTFMTGHYRRQK